jgi:hypothetical protein
MTRKERQDLKAKFFAMTDRQLFAGWRKYSEDQLKVLFQELEAREKATDFGRKPDSRRSA